MHSLSLMHKWFQLLPMDSVWLLLLCYVFGSIVVLLCDDLSYVLTRSEKEICASNTRGKNLFKATLKQLSSMHNQAKDLGKRNSAEAIKETDIHGWISKLENEKIYVCLLVITYNHDKTD